MLLNSPARPEPNPIWLIAYKSINLTWQFVVQVDIINLIKKWNGFELGQYLLPLDINNLTHIPPYPLPPLPKIEVMSTRFRGVGVCPQVGPMHGCSGQKTWLPYSSGEESILVNCRAHLMRGTLNSDQALATCDAWLRCGVHHESWMYGNGCERPLLHVYQFF